MSERPYEMRSGLEVIEALDKASRSLHASAAELSKLSQEFHEAHVSAEGEVINGVGLQYDIAIKEELVTIYEDALSSDPPRRPPAEDVRRAMAERAVRVKNPALWAEYQHKNARIEALRSWITNLKATISANQTLTKSEFA